MISREFECFAYQAFIGVSFLKDVSTVTSHLWRLELLLVFRAHTVVRLCYMLE